MPRSAARPVLQQQSRNHRSAARDAVGCRVRLEPAGAQRAGAQGLAQFLPDTCAAQGVNATATADPSSQADGIVSQAGHLCTLLAAVTADLPLAGDRLVLALAAYDAGLGVVQRHALTRKPAVLGASATCWPAIRNRLLEDASTGWAATDLSRPEPERCTGVWRLARAMWRPELAPGSLVNLWLLGASGSRPRALRPSASTVTP